jgi:uncharacterized protein (DUF1800 family)
MAGLNPLAGALGNKRAAHLLRRATFGPTKAEVDQFATQTAAQAVANLFQNVPEPAPPIDPATNDTWTDKAPSAMPANASEDGDLQEVFKRWHLRLMLDSGMNAKEKVVFFLHTHFPAIQSVIDRSRALYFQNVLFRQYAFDKTGTRTFKDLVRRICIDNAMLRLLDGRLNIKGRIQENFARELIELYTVGRGRNVQPTGPDDYVVFKQQDVEEGARVMTGYVDDNNYDTLDEVTGLPRGIARPAQHDNSVKTFSAAFNNGVVQPRADLLQAGQPTEASMLDELDQFIDLIFSLEETSMNICRKIYRFFVYYDITDEIDNNIIRPLAQDFRNNGFRIQPIIERLLTSQHFYDSATADVNDDNFGAIIKSPIDLTIGVMHVFGIKSTDIEDFEESAARLLDSMTAQGMNFYEPFDVAGHDAYYQEPGYNRNWISTNRLVNRYQLIDDMMAMDTMMGGMAKNRYNFNVDVIRFVENNITNPANPMALVTELAAIILPEAISDERRNYFKFILNEDLSDMNWAVEWNNRANPAGGARLQITRLFNAMMQSPEYQLF